MANLPVNIDFHIIRTATPFPNILGPLMINDYIQGLKLGRKNNEAHLREFALNQSNRQHEKFNQQRILSTLSAGKAYEMWCNSWWLPGTQIRQLMQGVFAQLDNLKLQGVANNIDIPRVWTIQRERKIITALLQVVSSTHRDQQRENEALEFYSKADFPGSLTQTFMEVIYPHMDYCQQENQYAEQHGNYLKSIFGEEAEATNLISTCIAETWRDIREASGDNRFDLAQTVTEIKPVISWVVMMRPLFDLADTPLTTIPPTLDGLDGIALLAPGEGVNRLQSDLWRNVGETNNNEQLAT